MSITTQAAVLSRTEYDAEENHSYPLLPLFAQIAAQSYLPIGWNGYDVVSATPGSTSYGGRLGRADIQDSP